MILVGRDTTKCLYDMCLGLGKTITVIALLLTTQRERSLEGEGINTDKLRLTALGTRVVIYFVFLFFRSDLR